MMFGSHRVSPVLIGGVTAVLLGGVVFAFLKPQSSKSDANQVTIASPTVTNSGSPAAVASASLIPLATASITPSPSASQGLVWMQTASGWQAMQNAPACDDTLLLTLPADLSKVTSVLYPGQTRGGNYKPHGGFRFDTTANDQVTVTAPIDGYIVRGGRYLAEGEVQYTFDVMNNCGVMYRVGHLRVLPEKLQSLAATWPEPVEGDSRTQGVNPPLFIAKGSTLATTVGIIKDKNTFFDWGVYDYRKENQASASTAYQQAHQQDKELSWHAVCWFDWLSASDEKAIRALPPGDPTSKTKSDYCS